MNRVVISVPRVLDSAVSVWRDNTCNIDTGNLPATAVAPFNLKQVRAVPIETQMQNIIITPLSQQTNCARVTADVTIPVTLDITDANNVAYTTHSSITHTVDIVLFIPTAAAFPYTITSEGVIECTGSTCEHKQTTLRNVLFRVLTRVTAVTDLLIPCYGYAPLNHAEDYNRTADNNFLHQPLFPSGKVY